MPKITIKEIDNTQAGVTEYKNFSVLVFGPASASIANDRFDDNQVCEFTDPEDFIKTVGIVNTDVEGNNNWCGNYLAFALLNLGYTVLYRVTTYADLIKSATYEGLDDKSRYDFRYIITGDQSGSGVLTSNMLISSLATKRGDCVALCEIPHTAYTDPIKLMSAKIAGIKTAALDNKNADKYTAFFANRVSYLNLPNYTGTSSTSNEATYSNITVTGFQPASFHYLACAAKASVNFAEWYAVAGYTRGVSDYLINNIEVSFGEGAMNTLQPRTYTEPSETETDPYNRSVNLVIKLKGNSYLWGNRTAALLEGKKTGDEALRASHFLNIRQLCTTIKKQLYVTCHKFTFDPNSDILWINFKNEIAKMLDTMKADQGIRDYKITKVKTDKKAMFKANIRIVPIEAVEDFDITLYLEDSIAGNLALEENED